MRDEAAIRADLAPRGAAAWDVGDELEHGADDEADGPTIERGRE